MTHEATVEKIGDLLHGRLAGAERSDAVAHVRSCEECRELAATYATLSAEFDDDGAAGAHPPADLIVRYALGAHGIEERERTSVASHVRQCATCAGEIEAVGEAETELVSDGVPRTVGEPPARPAGRALLAPAFAAASVLVLLSYPAYLGLFEVPRIHERIALLESRRLPAATPPAWDGGPVHQRLLAAPLRGAGKAPIVIPLAAGQTYVTLEVDAGSLEELATGVTRFAVLDDAGASRWSRDLTAEQIRSYVRETGTLEFVVPVTALGSARRTLSVSRGATLLFEVPFVVEPGG
jgi:hypothetical protein